VKANKSEYSFMIDLQNHLIETNEQFILDSASLLGAVQTTWRHEGSSTKGAGAAIITYWQTQHEA
jgi:hypothetical protein